MNEKIRILISYDGSSNANDALDDLPRAGLPRAADALIVHVQEQWLSMPAGFTETKEIFMPSSSQSPIAVQLALSLEKPQTDENPQEILEEAVVRIKSFFPEWITETISVKGSPAREIIRQAKDWNADLIIVGSHGLTKSKKFLLGSVSQKIANEADCSVRVVRGQTWKNGSPSRLLIGLDGTMGANAAVEEVARRMWIIGSEVRLVVAHDKSENYKWICEFLSDARRTLERAELTVSELIEEGDPKQVIPALAEEWGADCIFLGANDPGNNENCLLGSVSTAVITRAHCMVEIVRQKADKTNNV